MQPKISIIVPVYNAEMYLEECLNSLIHQTLTEIEIICIDDGSQDGSVRILKECQRYDPRITVIAQENQGVSAARNAGLKQASAEYIMFCDSDDYFEKTTCQMVNDEIERSSPDAIIFNYKTLKNGNFTDRTINFEKEEFDGSECIEMLCRRCVGPIGKELKYPERLNSMATLWTKAYRKEIILKNNISFVDIKKIGSFEDGLFNIEFFLHAKKVKYIADVLYIYRRIYSTSMTSQYRENVKENIINQIDNIKRILGERSCHTAFQEALENRRALSFIEIGLTYICAPISFSAKSKKVKMLLQDKTFSEAIKKLDTQGMPIYWRIFFLFAQYKCWLFWMVMLIFINRIRKRR